MVKTAVFAQAADGGDPLADVGDGPRDELYLLRPILVNIDETCFFWIKHERDFFHFFRQQFQIFSVKLDLDPAIGTD